MLLKYLFNLVHIKNTVSFVYISRILFMQYSWNDMLNYSHFYYWTVIKNNKEIDLKRVINASTENNYQCEACFKLYKSKAGFYLHQKFDCGKEPQFQCPYCPHRSKRKGDLKRHIGTHCAKLQYEMISISDTFVSND